MLNDYLSKVKTTIEEKSNGEKKLFIDTPAEIKKESKNSKWRKK